MIARIALWLVARNPAMTIAHARRLAKLGLIIAAVLAFGALVLWLQAGEAADDRANQAIGAAVQREGDLTATINRTEEGNAARTIIEQDFRRDGGRSRAVYDQCLRTARTPAHCERFLPEREAGQRGTPP